MNLNCQWNSSVVRIQETVMKILNTCQKYNTYSKHQLATTSCRGKFLIVIHSKYLMTAMQLCQFVLVSQRSCEYIHISLWPCRKCMFAWGTSFMLILLYFKVKQDTFSMSSYASFWGFITIFRRKWAVYWPSFIDYN